MPKSILAIVSKANIASSFEQAILPNAAAKAVLALVPAPEVAALFEEGVTPEGFAKPVGPKTSTPMLKPQQQQNPRYASKADEKIAVQHQQDSGHGDLWASYEFLIR